MDSSLYCTRCKTVDGCVCATATKPSKTSKRSPTRVTPSWRKSKAWTAGIGAIVESVETEREACIRILEDMRPRNDQSDWNEFTVTTDTILRLAIEAINRRYPA